MPTDLEARRRLLLDTEWIVTNGIGGYSSGTVAGINTRRHHGHLVAALENPLGRVVMLNQVEARAGSGADGVLLADCVDRFRLEAGLPVWEYAVEGSRIERRLVMVHGQNTVHESYRLRSGKRVMLELSPCLHFRGYEDAVDTELNSPSTTEYVWLALADGIQVGTEGLPPLQLRLVGAESRFNRIPAVTPPLGYPVEESRGYQSQGTLWCPGTFEIELSADDPVWIVASAEASDLVDALPPLAAAACEQERRRRLLRTASPTITDDVGAELVLAADQFIITPRGRLRDAVRARAMGDEVRTIIAGYHWFTDWGRDTMISLEGLTLVSGRHREAAFILRTFAEYVREGLIPNMFPDGSNEGLYHTADATLWYFHAVDRYLAATDDEDFLPIVFPTLQSIIEYHIRGTRFGIGMDPDDALIRQGAEGYQLTWMDAKVDGWVVTPRRGKAVEINALWFNALSLIANWTEALRGTGEAAPYRDLADRARVSFNRRFWNPERGHLFDVVDGENRDSAECRPNQIFAISLPHPVLERQRWAPVIEVVRRELLTPVGLRSLAPHESEYKPRYFGDLRTRDAAYHQGTVWAWLIGPWIDAWLKLHPDDLAGARRDLDGLIAHLDDFGIGSVAEVFDATDPYTARGCIAQAWSVAELLRCWARVGSTD